MIDHANWQLTKLERATLLTSMAGSLGLKDNAKYGRDRIWLARAEAFTSLEFGEFCEACTCCLDVIDAARGEDFRTTASTVAKAFGVTPDIAAHALKMIGAKPRDGDSFVMDANSTLRPRDLFQTKAAA